jgi:hypothetical protein
LQSIFSTTGDYLRRMAHQHRRMPLTLCYRWAIRYWIELLLANDIIDPVIGKKMVRSARKIFFADRTPQRICQALTNELSSARLRTIMEWSNYQIPDVKAMDTRLTLRLVHEMEKESRGWDRKGPRMANNDPGNPSLLPSDSLAELIGRSLTDRDFRELLFTNRARALRGYSLSEMDFEAIEKLDRTKLEDAATKLSGRTDLAIKVVITKRFWRAVMSLHPAERVSTR